MKVRSYHNYKIGMSAACGGKSLSICAKRAEMEQSELVFTYILGSRELYAPEPRYPEKLHGRSLAGTVVKCENETVKIQLDIDRDSGNTKTEGDLYAFPWQPDTGNLMYCMPEKDTMVTLYIGGSNEGEAIAVHSLRKGTEKDTDKPENRYLTTKDQKRMFLKPKELGYSLEDKEEGKTHFILKDEKGITFRTDQKLVVQAKGNLKIAGKDITVEGKKAVNIRQKSAGVEIKNKVNVKGKMTYLGFGATMGEMADRAETLTLKQKPGEETEGKSTPVMTSGKLGQMGSADKSSGNGSGNNGRGGAGSAKNRIQPPIEVKAFNIKEKFSSDDELKEEYIRQLKGQEDGLNRLTVEEYLNNRQAYKDRQEEQKKAGKKNPSGRAEEGSQAQKKARLEAFQDKIEELMESEDISEGEAEKKAEEWLETQAALHDPDQIAGGNPENITGMGNARINFSIGSQWRYRADDVEEQVREYLKTNNIPEKEWGSIYLNIKMPYEFE